MHCKRWLRILNADNKIIARCRSVSVAQKKIVLSIIIKNLASFHLWQFCASDSVCLLTLRALQMFVLLLLLLLLVLVR